MKQFLYIVLLSVVMAFSTSCGTHYYDAIPSEVSTMTIPREGGLFEFKVVDYEMAYSTRFQPGMMFKYYRYRVVEDGVAGKEAEKMIETANKTGKLLMIAHCCRFHAAAYKIKKLIEAAKLWIIFM